MIGQMLIRVFSPPKKMDWYSLLGISLPDEELKLVLEWP